MFLRTILFFLSLISILCILEVKSKDLTYAANQKTCQHVIIDQYAQIIENDFFRHIFTVRQHLPPQERLQGELALLTRIVDVEKAHVKRIEKFLLYDDGSHPWIMYDRREQNKLEEEIALLMMCQRFGIEKDHYQGYLQELFLKFQALNKFLLIRDEKFNQRLRQIEIAHKQRQAQKQNPQAQPTLNSPQQQGQRAPVLNGQVQPGPNSNPQSRGSSPTGQGLRKNGKK